MRVDLLLEGCTELLILLLSKQELHQLLVKEAWPCRFHAETAAVICCGYAWADTAQATPTEIAWSIPRTCACALWYFLFLFSDTVLSLRE